MAVSEIPSPSYNVNSTPQQRDKEILASMESLIQWGRTFAVHASQGSHANGLLDSGTVVAELADGTFCAYDAETTPVAVNEVQHLVIDATGGTFTATVLGKTTAAVAYNASAATFKAAIVEAIPEATADDFTVTKTGSGAGVYDITYKGRYGFKNQPQLTAAAGSLTGGAGTATPTTTTAGVAGAADGSMTAKGVLRSAIDTSTATQLGNVVFGGVLKLNQLVGLTDDAVADLNGRVDVTGNLFIF